jgi:hypothetical protein
LGPRKSGMPAAVLMPAPVCTTERSAATIRQRVADRAYIPRRDCILAWSIILSVHGVDPIADLSLSALIS